MKYDANLKSYVLKCERCSATVWTKSNRRKYCMGCKDIMRIIKQKERYINNPQARQEERIRYKLKKIKTDKDFEARAMREWRKNNPKKAKEIYKKCHKKFGYMMKVGSLVKRAVDRGDIIKPKRCKLCDKKAKVYSHHEDYDKPYRIIWLCKECHYRIHKFKRIVKKLFRKLYERK